MSHQKTTIVIPVAIPTPTISHIYIPLQAQRVEGPQVLNPVTSNRVPVSQPTQPQRVQKEVSTPKPLSATLPFQNKYTPNNKRKTEKKTLSNYS